MKKRTRGISLKKNGKKKKRRRKKKTKPEFLQYVNDVPKYDDPDIVSPSVELFITLFDNICKDQYGKKIPIKSPETYTKGCFVSLPHFKFGFSLLESLIILKIV